MGMGGWLHTNVGLGQKAGSRILLGEEDWKLAEATIQQLESGEPIRRKVRPASRASASSSATTGEGFKRQTDLAWQEHLIAFVPLNFSSGGPQGARFIAAQWQDIVDLDFDELLVCESMPVLGNLRQCRWLFSHHYPAGRKVIAIFCGNQASSFKPAAAAAFMAATHQPLSAFVSYDPFGLRAAAKLPRVDRLCLPPPEQLARAPRLDPRTVATRLERVGEAMSHCRHKPVLQCWWNLAGPRIGVDIKDLVTA